MFDIREVIDPLDLEERRKHHLREGLRPDNFPSLKQKECFRDYLSGLRLQAEKGQETAFLPMKFSIHEQNRLFGDQDGSFGKVYFGRHYQLTALALMTLVDETDRFLPMIEDLLWLMCNEYTWATSNHLKADYPPEKTVDLFAAETAQMMAEVITLLDGRLHPAVTQRVNQQIEERVFSPLFNDSRSFWWEASPSNWAAVCSGAVGMAALLLETDKNRLCGMLRRILDTMACFLKGFRGDGGCEEGIAYWNYGFGFYVYFAESLRAFTRGGIDLLTDQRVPTETIRLVAEFPARISLSNQTFLNYSDALVDMPLATGLLSRLTERLGIEVPRPERMTEYPGRTSTPTKWAHASRALAWTSETLFGERKLAEGTHFFPDLVWVLDRRYTGAKHSRMVAFSAKGGHNLEFHNHNDLGHFILHAGGENLLVDLGQGRYGAGYAESLNKLSEGHSVPRINGQGQPRGREFRAEALAFPTQAEGGVVPFELDLTQAYAVPGLRSFVRRFEWRPQKTADSPAVLTLTDSFQFDSKSTAGNQNVIEEMFMSHCEPSINDGKAVWSGVTGRVVLEFDSNRTTPAIERFDVKRGNSGPTQTCYRLQLSLNEVGENEKIRLRFLVSVDGS